MPLHSCRIFIKILLYIYNYIYIKGDTDSVAGGALAPPLLLFEGIAPPVFLDPSSECVLTLARAAPRKL